ncbi:hypothetical protein N0V93_003771 [Gnomoniopsis smithogilvyi]|uniref:Uncharacterized protein n=1 Tax=Gnomoniopsis smithogilvyi TaxID=1191159 RepID=A0A9W8Z126_9PEZI|nr:hypothetical protein N0V93_003771 [Gnomoniopsis smithogilvyi]
MSVPMASSLALKFGAALEGNMAATGQANALPDETNELAEKGSIGFQVQQEDLLSPNSRLPGVSQDEELNDLAKYGPPEALEKLNQTVPVKVMSVIEKSIHNVQAQVDAETAMRHRQERERGRSPQEQQYRSRDEYHVSIDKGKGLDTSQVTPVSGPASSIASDQTDTASFYTPPEGGQSPSADAQCETETETHVATAEDSNHEFTPMPRFKASSTSAIPRRRDLIKAMFRGMSDTDARRHVLRRSTGALQFKAKLKHARQVWQGEIQIGIKQRAKVNAAKRHAQEERERVEAQELHQALEVIAKIEAEAAEKQERVRVAKEACRKSQLQYTYAGYKAIVEELNEFQRSLLDGDHQRDQDHLTLKILESMDGLRVKHEAKLRLLEEASKTKIGEKIRELDEEWLDHIAEERRLDQWAEQVEHGEFREAGLPDDQNCRLEQGRETYLKRRNDTLERLRYVLDEEVAIEQELMDAKKARIRESFKVQERELRVKIRSQLRWLELVSTERTRLLEEHMALELADEIKDDDDNRWNSILVREEAGKTGPSRFRSASRYVRG